MDTNFSLFCIQISLLIATGMLGGKVASKFNLPPVLGELVGGILLGPTFFGLMFPGSFNWVFPKESMNTIGVEIFAKLGALFFMFSTGLELSLSYLRRNLFSIGIVGFLSIFIPFILGVLAVVLMPSIWGSQINRPVFILFIGVALSISALPVIARILTDLALIKTKLGTIILSAATINDLFGWLLFSLIVTIFKTGTMDIKISKTNLGLFICLVALITVVYVTSHGKKSGLMRWRFMRSGNYIGIVTFAILAASSITETIGIHAIFGAYLVGAILSLKNKTPNITFEVINGFANNVFTPIYFVSIGLSINFSQYFDLRLILLLVLIASLGKIGGAFVGGIISGIPKREALGIGIGMNARGAMEILLASLALDYQIIDPRTFVALVTMAVVTTVITAPLLKIVLSREVFGIRERLTSREYPNETLAS